jgi:hypothetical protein
MSAPLTGETIMRLNTDHVKESINKTAQPPLDERVSDGAIDTPREMDPSFEEIER